MAKSYIFSSESVTEGHPDKVADTISDAVLDACLAQDKQQPRRLRNDGEIEPRRRRRGNHHATADFDYNKVVRNAIEEIGYTEPGESFNAKGVHILNALTARSPDIAQGVDEKAAEGKATAEQGAGDQGLMFGFACTGPIPDARTYLLRARAGRAPDQASQGGQGRLAPPRLQNAGLAPIQRHEDRAHRRGRRLDPAP